MSDLDQLREVGQLLRQPGFEELLQTRGRRTRRARLVIASSLAIAVIAFVAALAATRGNPPTDPAPVAPSPTPTPGAPVRKVTYGDGYWPTTTIHYGDRTVDLPRELSVSPVETGVVHMDVTDDGVVFTIAKQSGSGRGVWFTDGVDTHRIGRIHGYLGIRNDVAVVSDTAGSRVAWIEESGSTGDHVVVYDTHADREVASVPVPACSATPRTGCELNALIGEEHVYFTTTHVFDRRPDLLMRLDLSRGTLEQVTPRQLAADVVSGPRGLIVGESPSAGVASDGYGTVFAVNGDHLVPMKEHLAATDLLNSPTKAFDTRTGRQLRLRLPAGYGAPDEVTAFEWLDDDHLALMNAANTFHETQADILVCRISTGQCEVVAPAKSGNVRIVPHLPLPG